MQHTNPGRIEPRFLEGRRSIKLDGNRQEKLDELSTEESTLDWRAEPFFVRCSTL